MLFFCQADLLITNKALTGMQTANHTNVDKQGDVTVDSKVPSDII